MIHWSSVPRVPPPGGDATWMRKKVTEAIVSLYRRSQMTGETGRLFLVHQPNLTTNEMEIGLVRTDDPAQICGLQVFYSGALRELQSEEILNLFKVA